MEKFAFSNFQPARVLCSFGIEYPTVEHAYQAMKTRHTGERLRIKALATPGQAKRAASKLTTRADWDQAKETVMLFLLRQKFRPGSEHAQRLQATGDSEIVEWNNWHDQFWGRCVCSRCGRQGQNKLGQTLMQIRSKLQDR